MLRKPRNERLIPGLLVLSFCVISLEVIYVMVYDRKKLGQLGQVRIKIMKNMTGIPGYSFIKMRLITKGLSGDKKFYLETEDGQRFLARISEGLEYERKKTEYELLMKVSKIGIPAPTPVGFGYCEDQSKIYTLLSWVDGEDAQKVLPGFSQEKQ